MNPRDLTPEQLGEAADPQQSPGSAAPSQAPYGRRPRFDQEPQVLSVGELDRRLKRMLEGSTNDVRVEGEIVGLRVHGSGHAYFTLKDEHEEAAIDCVMYRTAPPRSRRLLADGARVVLAGRASLYVPRGRLQFLAEVAWPKGRGALLEALERLKEKLVAEGLFAPERKRPIPQDPQVIGIVTSGDGAAIHDIVTVAFRRGSARLILARTPVQGVGAALRMVRAIEMLEAFPGLEVIIIGRGGGSADDLSAFNEESVVRKVAAARVPVVSAVGHEIDTSLTDLAADARAATPSQAAEMLVPDAQARRASLDHLKARMRRAVHHKVRNMRVDIDRLHARLGSPERLLAEPQQRIDDASIRLRHAINRILADDRTQLQRLERRLASQHPRAVLAGANAALSPLHVRLESAMRGYLGLMRNRLASDMARLDALSPLNVLARGYAIATDDRGRAIRDHQEVRAGQRLVVRVHHGTVLTTVLGTAPPGEPFRPVEPDDTPRGTTPKRQKRTMPTSAVHQLGLEFGGNDSNVESDEIGRGSRVEGRTDVEP